MNPLDKELLILFRYFNYYWRI